MCTVCTVRVIVLRMVLIWRHPYQVQTYQREVREPHETPVDHLGRVVGLVAPSMFLTSLSEATCFFLAALSDMPAVYSFAINAGFAILIDFFMQVSYCRKMFFKIHIGYMVVSSHVFTSSHHHLDNFLFSLYWLIRLIGQELISNTKGPTGTCPSIRMYIAPYERILAQSSPHFLRSLASSPWSPLTPPDRRATDSTSSAASRRTQSQRTRNTGRHCY